MMMMSVFGLLNPHQMAERGNDITKDDHTQKKAMIIAAANVQH